MLHVQAEVRYVIWIPVPRMVGQTNVSDLVWLPVAQTLFEDILKKKPTYSF